MMIIDRIENGYAVLEIGENRFDTVPVSVLPKGAREGSVLAERNGVYTLDAAAEKARKKRLLGMQARLFGEE
ncbi:MAG: DUF3006 domain-containing protein [Clostridia bacterium]|nr:DUF3006 domain-containing protein [Clostridia bacterium]